MDKSEIVEDLRARYDKYVQDVKVEKKAIQERLAEQERVEVAASRERLIRQAAINIENEVEENFKAGAWGGYDGLPVRSCRVSHNGVEI